jgi:hypothetical protein
MNFCHFVNDSFHHSSPTSPSFTNGNHDGVPVVRIVVVVLNIEIVDIVIIVIVVVVVIVIVVIDISNDISCYTASCKHKVEESEGTKKKK